jgi:hypothetical protein
MMEYMPGGSKFWETHMGQDLREKFPILNDPNKRSTIKDIGVTLFEYLYLEKLLKWPIPIPIHVPDEFRNNSNKNLPKS